MHVASLFLSVKNVTFDFFFCAGFACPNATSVPLPCSPGQYALAGALACTSCPAGMVGILAYCVGEKCRLKDSFVFSRIPGSSCASTGAAPVPCGAGSYSVGASVDCTVCAPGYACPSTTSAASVVACAPGTYAVGAATACTVCAAGHACPSTVLALQVPCLPGYEEASRLHCIRL